MTMEQRVRLWDAVNQYVTTCGGDPSRHVYGNTRRQAAVAEVERAVRALDEALNDHAVTGALCEMLDRFAPTNDGLSEAEIACAERARRALREVGQ